MRFRILIYLLKYYKLRFLKITNRFYSFQLVRFFIVFQTQFVLNKKISIRSHFFHSCYDDGDAVGGGDAPFIIFT